MRIKKGISCWKIGHDRTLINRVKIARIMPFQLINGFYVILVGMNLFVMASNFHKRAKIDRSINAPSVAGRF